MLALAGLFCAPFLAAACAAYRALSPHSAWRPVTFACLWGLGEWLRGTLIFGGFPWNLAGYVWTPWPAMAQFAAIAGAYGLGALTIFICAAPVTLLPGPAPGSTRAWLAPTAALALLAANAAAGLIILPRSDANPSAATHLRLVQANIAQPHKWQKNRITEQFQRHAALSTAHAETPPDIVIWPETASPYDLSYRFDERSLVLRSVPPNGGLIAGALRIDRAPDGARRVWNSMQAMDDAGRITAVYDKFHLVPFGEYAPLRKLLFALRLVPGDTDFSRGPGPQTLAIPGAPPFSPLICYEAIFPGDVIDPARRPQWMLNITNDAWYGISSGPYQHFEQTRLRAIEEGIPLVRVANTGISGVIDAWGRVTAKTTLGNAAIIDAALPPPRPNPPLFARAGNLPTLIFLAGGLVLFLVSRRRKTAP